MTVSTVLFCSDRSDAGVRALTAGFLLLSPIERAIIATVVDPVDPSLILGSSFASGVATLDQADQIRRERLTDADQSLARVQAALAISTVEPVIMENDAPGPALCDLAVSLRASAMVIGTHGRAGLRRAVLGSVSDHIVRHAPCPVVVSAVEDTEPRGSV